MECKRFLDNGFHAWYDDNRSNALALPCFRKAEFYRFKALLIRGVSANDRYAERNERTWTSWKNCPLPVWFL